MSKYCINILLMVILVVASFGRSSAQGADTQKPPLLITEVQTGTGLSASQEFIELHNVSSESLDLTGWKVQYASATNTDWSKPSRTIELSGVIDPDAYVLISSNDYLPQASFYFASTLAQSGGHIRVISPVDADLFDLIGWGTAAAPQGSAAEAASAGQSMMRSLDAQSQYVHTADNYSDFTITASPTPGAENSMPVDETSAEPEANAEVPEASNEDIEPIAWPDIRITELLPNPSPPALDSEAEFVELFNTTNDTVDLTGFTIKTGLKLSYSYTIDKQSIGPGEYLAFTSAQTSLTLSNTASKAVLYAPDNSVLFETAAYEKAANGQSWILNGSDWMWTTESTQGSENILAVPELVLSVNSPKTKAASNKKTATKKSAAKKSTTKKAKTTKPKLSTAKDTSQDIAATAGSTQTPTRPMHPLVLAGIGSVVVLYALYEYRHDMANRYRQFRANRAARRALSRPSETAGGH